MMNKNNLFQLNHSAFLAIFAYIWWGLLPIYWKSLSSLPSGEILAHRIFWAGFFMIFLSTIQGNLSLFIKVLKEDRNSIYRCICSSLVISANWLLYIWAVNSGYVLESSIGYFIAPIVNVVIGMVFLKERLNRLQFLSVFLVFIGILTLCFKFGHIPFIAIGLALSFSVYSYFRKTSRLNPVQGITIETVILMPLSIIYIFILSAKGLNSFTFQNWLLSLLLIGGGLVTIVPVLCFSKAAKNIKLSSLGFFQYIMPTSQFLLAIFVYKESISLPQFIAFSFIWLALFIYSYSTYKAAIKIKI
jgi:chloramphenicol-sensitive protein RarD